MLGGGNAARPTVVGVPWSDPTYNEATCTAPITVCPRRLAAKEKPRKTEVFRGCKQYQLDILSGVDLDTGAHGSGDGAGTDILALGSSGLSLDNSLNQ